MSVPVIQLADAVATMLNGIVTPNPQIVRRYVPFYDPKLVKDGKWFVVASNDERKQSNKVDSTKLTIDLGYQKALPETSKEYPEPIDNLPFLDACMATVEAMKVHFAEGGLFRQYAVNNRWMLNDATQPLLYVQSMLFEYQIFTSAIKLEFLDEGI